MAETVNPLLPSCRVFMVSLYVVLLMIVSAKV
jgi:hypothetical protein